MLKRLFKLSLILNAVIFLQMIGDIRKIDKKSFSLKDPHKT
jgi:hypothetical protein